jgi:hypothetical protein
MPPSDPVSVAATVTAAEEFREEDCSADFFLCHARYDSCERFFLTSRVQIGITAFPSPPHWLQTIAALLEPLSIDPCPFKGAEHMSHMQKQLLRTPGLDGSSPHFKHITIYDAPPAQYWLFSDRPSRLMKPDWLLAVTYCLVTGNIADE